MKFGLECVNELIWSGWEPGGDYIKILKLKNYSSDVLIIKYELPSTKYYYMDFPKRIILSPGNHVNLNVHFRPNMFEEYDDYIRIHVCKRDDKKNIESFHVIVKSRLPRLVLSYPNILDFGACPVNEISRKVFKLTNDGEIDVEYELKINNNLIRISPRIGRLTAGSQIDIEIYFAPIEAMVLNMNIICLANNNILDQPLLLKAVAKYPYLQVSNNNINFGQVINGANMQKNISIYNRSPVHATVKIENVLIKKNVTNEYCPFIFEPSEFIILPNDQKEIIVNYNPISSGTFTNETFKLILPCSNILPAKEISCQGNCVDYNINLDESLLDFGEVNIGKSVSRTFNIINETLLPCHFQIQSSKIGSFKFSTYSGIIPPQLSTKIIVTFSPIHAINYYKKIYIMFQNSKPLTLELLATSFSDEIRPETLTQRHIAMHHIRCNNKLAQYSPTQLIEYLDELNENDYKKLILPPDEEDKKINISKKQNNNDYNCYQEYIYENQLENLNSLAIIKETYIDFGRCDQIGSPHFREIQVINRTNGKLTCCWDQKLNSSFQILPPIQDIHPNSITKFRIKFTPKANREYIGEQLDAYCYFKSNRTFRLVDDRAFIPPTVCSLYCRAQTFPVGTEEYLPHISFIPKFITLPSCLVGTKTYQTLTLKNIGDAPVVFNFGTNNISNYFRLKPECGTISPNSVCMIIVEFSPQTPERFTEHIQCKLNASMEAKIITLYGEAYTPQITFSNINKNKLYFKPTSVGLTSTRELLINNISRIPLNLKWSISPKIEEIVSINPQEINLRGNESLPIKVSFKPIQNQQYYLEIPCIIDSIIDENCPMIKTSNNKLNKSKISILEIFGESRSGMIQMTPRLMELDEIQINELYFTSFTLHNDNEVSVSYSLNVSCIEGSSDCNLELRSTSGHIAAHSNKTVKLKILIPNVGKFQFKIDCQNNFDNEILSSCNIIGYGTFPRLQIKYVENTLLNHPINNTWEKLQINRINKILDIKQQGLSDTIDINLGDAMLGSEPIEYHFEFQNITNLLLKWNVKLKHERNSFSAGWTAGTTQEKNVTLNDAIIENELFEIYPTDGVIKPQERIIIIFKYYNNYAGHFSVIYNLIIENGQIFPLHLTAHTRKAPITSLTMSSIQNLVQFHDVTCGIEPPLQYFPLINDTPYDLIYNVDPKSIDKYQQKNLNFPIFKCINSSGTIKAKSIEYLLWYFKPLQAKSYILPIEIHTAAAKDTSRLKHFDIINICGNGILENINEKSVQVIPSKQQLPSSNRLIKLSAESINFGTFNRFGGCDAFVNITNLCKNDRVEFSWSLFLSTVKNICQFEIAVDPPNGILEVNETISCRIQFKHGTQTVILNEILCCQSKIVDDEINKELIDDSDNKLNILGVKSIENNNTNTIVEPEFMSVTLRGTLSRKLDDKPLTQRIKENTQKALIAHSTSQYASPSIQNLQDQIFGGNIRNTNENQTIDCCYLKVIGCALNNISPLEKVDKIVKQITKNNQSATNALNKIKEKQSQIKEKLEAALLNTFSV